jgi:hypothetical protein
MMGFVTLPILPQKSSSRYCERGIEPYRHVSGRFVTRLTRYPAISSRNINTIGCTGDA